MIKVEEYLKKKCLPDNEWIVINCPLAFMQQKQHREVPRKPHFLLSQKLF